MMYMIIVQYSIIINTIQVRWLNTYTLHIETEIA